MVDVTRHLPAYTHRRERQSPNGDLDQRLTTNNNQQRPTLFLVQPCARQRQTRRGTCAVRDRQCRFVREDIRRCEHDLERACLLHAESGRAVVGLSIGAVRR